MNVVLAGGGTAGHVEPALALADALVHRDPSTVVTALGTARGLETALVPARGYDLDLIPPVPLPRHLSLDLFTVPYRLWRATRAARAVLARRQADVVVGFGGYVALPAYLAARRARVPVVIHEANARTGLANRIGARWAVTVATAQTVGIPLRPAIADLNRDALKAKGRKAFGLDPTMPTLLVTGGSQGARRVNDAVTGAAPVLAAAGVQVLHATGAKNAEDVRRALAGGRYDHYTVVPYVDRMDLAYAAADLILCRAGAMTVAEVSAVGLPAVYVPLPIGNGEQRLNAAAVVAAGGALLVDDAELDSGWVGAYVPPLLHDAARLATMAKSAAAQGNRAAADRLADLVVAAAGR